MLAGTWTRGWEQDEFVPDARPGQVWSVSAIGALGHAGHDDWTRRGLQDVHVLMTGYVSSAGPMDARGRERRRFVATSAVRLPACCLPEPTNLLLPPGAM